MIEIHTLQLPEDDRHKAPWMILSLSLPVSIPFLGQGMIKYPPASTINTIALLLGLLLCWPASSGRSTQLVKASYFHAAVKALTTLKIPQAASWNTDNTMFDDLWTISSRQIKAQDDKREKTAKMDKAA